VTSVFQQSKIISSSYFIDVVLGATLWSYRPICLIILKTSIMSPRNLLYVSVGKPKWTRRSVCDFFLKNEITSLVAFFASSRWLLHYLFVGWPRTPSWHIPGVVLPQICRNLYMYFCLCIWNFFWLNLICYMLYLSSVECGPGRIAQNQKLHLSFIWVSFSISWAVQRSVDIRSSTRP